MASPSIPIPPPEIPSRNWLELPVELMMSIFNLVGVIEVLTSARKVCRTWRQICSVPEMYRVLDLRYTGDLCHIELRNMTRKAVDMSAGQLIDLSIRRFADDELLNYIGDRSSQLRRLCLISCISITSDGLSEMVRKLPLLEELQLRRIQVSKKAIEVAGQHCPQLKSFKLYTIGEGYVHPDIERDENALAIAANMHELRHLQLLGNRITTGGLLAILDTCPHLESLDMRQCLNVANLEPDLLRRLSQQMKDLKLTYDSLEDLEFVDDVFGDLGGFMVFDDLSGLSDFEIVSDDYDDDDHDDDHDYYDDDACGSDIYLYYG